MASWQKEKTPLAWSSMSTLEHSFSCPYCGEEISMVLDLSADAQNFIEDCEVCCRPIDVSLTAQDGELITFHAGRT